jgi:hypothetical protein
MKMYGSLISFLFLIIPSLALAGWEVAKPESSIPQEPFFEAGKQQKTAFMPKNYYHPKEYPGRPAAYTPAPVNYHRAKEFAAPTPFLPTAYSTKKFPNQYAALGQPAAVYAVSISGSLKENIERIMGRYHWKVIWKAPYDYNFDGRITGASLPSVVEKLLQPFPLQAVMYMSNRTIAVVPRTRV